MRNRFSVVFWVLILSLFAFTGSGLCAGSPAKSSDKPSDKEIIAAVDASGALNRADGRFTVVSPPTIAEKGKVNKDGSWPVKVKVTVTYKTKDGRNAPPTETTTLFRIFRAKDDAGKSIWKAELGS